MTAQDKALSYAMFGNDIPEWFNCNMSSEEFDIRMSRRESLHKRVQKKVIERILPGIVRRVK